MADYRFTVYHVGIHARDALEPERVELEKAGARQIVLPRFETEEEMMDQIKAADGLVVVDSPVTRRFMESLKDCKVILRTGVGVDVIDVEAATDLGIAVINVPDLWIREVANHALALLLALNRRLFKLGDLVRSGQWVPIIPPPVGSVHGETLGIVGLGQVGRALARRAAAFELEVLAVDPYIDESVFGQHGATRASFDEVLASSDYVSIHCPLTDETRHMFDDSAFGKMKPTAYVINTARGPIVHEEALVRALQQGRIAGAGLDVLEAEPIASDSPLLTLENVVITPHSAYYSDKAIRELPVRCGQEVARVLEGRRPLNLVNPKVLEKLPLSAE